MKDLDNNGTHQNLLIMRHGEAAAGAPDHLRRLTSRGEQEVGLMAKWLASRVEKGEFGALRVIASPYVRAQQTAQLIGKALGCEVETYKGITPDDAPHDVCEWLMTQSEPIILVSHMPLVGELTGVLTEGRAGFGVGFSTAAVAELKAEIWASGCASLTRLTAPGELKNIS
ncbi:phosphohistidine phosphatase SixA [Halomonas sp. LS-001]